MDVLYKIKGATGLHNPQSGKRMLRNQAPESFGKFRPSIGLRALLAAAHHSFLGRGSARHAIAHLLRKTHGDVVDLKIWGVQARLYLTNTNERRATVQPNRYNKVELEFLASHLAKTNATFLDIGANAGLYTLNLAARATLPCIYLAIEPNPEMVVRATTNLKNLNPQFEVQGIDIRILETALGSDEGSAELLVTGRGMGAAQIVTSGGDHKISMQKLLTVIKQQDIDHVDALKIDVEGFEDQILLPFFNEAPSSLHPRAIVIEHASADEWTDDVIMELRRIGYIEVARTRGNTLLSL